MPDFPPALRTLVEHMILSHHGQLEFGSPKVPLFPEALLLHYLDDMDSKMECMRALVENDRQVEGCFTAFHTALARPALKKDRYLGGGGELDARAPRRGRTSRWTHPHPRRPAAPVAAPERAAHPLFAPGADSVFADKLKQALRPALPEQES